MARFAREISGAHERKRRVSDITNGRASAMHAQKHSLAKGGMT
jgi:hypothetical protein